MVLVDTSIWIDHLRRVNAGIVQLLEQGQVITHPFVIGELACGPLRRRKDILYLLSTLPSIQKVEDEEVLYFIEKHHLMGKEIGLMDAHLLASAVLSNIPLWTSDRRLKKMAEQIEVLYDRLI